MKTLVTMMALALCVGSAGCTPQAPAVSPQQACFEAYQAFYRVTHKEAGSKTGEQMVHWLALVKAASEWVKAACGAEPYVPPPHMIGK